MDEEEGAIERRDGRDDVIPSLRGGGDEDEDEDEAEAVMLVRGEERRQIYLCQQKVPYANRRA